ncbi:MAG TPA: HAMP domain-containing sensor histidine kinase [Tepidisphaeraceae bacterium]|nr:HAMP domain-containing sensor histidine kinase [Tepidisphaeraceae bacterium]
MTLGRKILIKNAALLVALVVLACVATQGLLRLRASTRTVLTAYRQLQRIETAETDVTAAKSGLVRGQTAGPALTAPLQSAVTRIDEFFAVTGYDYSTGDAAMAIADVRQASNALTDLVALANEPVASVAQAARLSDMSTRTDAALALLHQAATSCDKFIRAQEAGTEQQFHTTLILVVILSSVILLTAILLSASQYRSSVLPLRRIREGVRKMSRGQFQERLALANVEPEFAGLVDEFNAMAAKLDEFYHELERKVAQKSRELVRSERLASVGFLAAGVAHEINNPLNIISGYAELSLKKMSADLAGPATRGRVTPATIAGRTGASDPIKSLQIIRDEAFRCKEITQKLLSLARGGSDARVPVSLPKAAEEVATMVGGLSQYRDRRLVLGFDDSSALVVMANVTEIKQVLLNLTVNALEATPPGTGEVRIQGRWRDGAIELSVRDNGRGMSRQTIERVFEPFYTERRGTIDDRSGTGLGLTISHAIVESHGGQLRAESEGPGMGSEFVIRLPAASREAELETVL